MQSLKFTSHWWVFLAAALGTFIVVIDQSATSIVTPKIAVQFGIDIPASQWITIVYILTVSVLMIPAGAIADQIGRKRVWSIGLIIFALSSVLTAFSPNYVVLLIGKILMGLGAVGVQSTGMAIVVNIFPDHQRSTATGLHMGVVGFGSLGGQVVGGVIESVFNWRAVFVFMFLFSILATIAALVFLVKDSKGSIIKGLTSFDWVGTFLFGAFLVVMILTVNFTNSFGWASFEIMVGMLFSIVLLIVFLILESKLSNPMFSLNVFRARNYSLGSLARLTCFIASSASFFLLPFYLVSVAGYSTGFAGMLLVPRGFCFMLFGPISGRIADFTGPRIPALFGMLMCSFALYLYTNLTLDTSVMMIIIITVLEGTGISFFLAPNSSAIMGSAGRENYGFASAFMNLTRNLGHIFGIALPAIIVSSMMLSLGYDPDLSDSKKLEDLGLKFAYIDSMSRAFLVSTFIMLSAAAMSVGVTASRVKANK